ncbi:LysM peptidoglycan-binding domain-containing protein [Acidovorax radicis]|uniref:LysM peptidoglycan-binding domain-containing protein n=1 Tax=Acidovorax radicis TaxID=758826 RepID=UPI001CF8EAC5|nr:LysM peptidoglycan-binding domain-containing protein [Acidovorax radicis]UCU99154.1 LysM peptidoglycan-binding domain-containing protein [Acidovorax radicis]
MTASTSVRRTALGALTIIAGAMLVMPVQAQNHPISSGQRATAQQVSERGVPLEELAPNAPDTYVVKRGDTLWGISGMYLKRPWRWPELWGMNLKAIPNPHLIFPGQTLYLEKDGAYARLRTSRSSEPETVRVSPRTRSDSLADSALPTLKPHLIEPFLVEPLVVDAQVLEHAPRVIATTEERVLMASGDRVYVRGDAASPMLAEAGEPRFYRVFRDAVALKDPVSGAVLGYEAQYLGKAELVRGEAFEEVPNGKGGYSAEYVPATVTLSATKEEVRAGDRLLPAPARAFANYIPRAPELDVDASVVSIYGSSSVTYAAQNQVVAINKGAEDGIEAGYVLSLLTKGARVKDSTDPSKAMIKLPSEINGTAMVFRTFDRVSYALILEIRDGVRVGDRLVNPK